MIRSTLTNPPIYFLSSTTIPVKIVHQLETIQYRFLWGDIKKPIKQGALGIKSLTELNTALRAKWLWRFLKEEDRLKRLLWPNGGILQTERGLAKLGGSTVLVYGGKF